VALHWPHERFYERLTRTSGAITYYERGIARVEDRWVGTGIADTTFVEPGHICANDLDIFGEGSLFELLCTARTRAGQETLARWLASPASRDEILQRQQAVEELRNNVDLREDLSRSTPDGAVIGMASIDEWTSAPPIFPMPIARRTAPILVAFTICALGYSYFTKDTTFLTAPLVLQIGFALFYRRRVSKIISTVREPAAEIGRLYAPLSRLEREQFHTPKLRELKSARGRSGDRRFASPVAHWSHCHAGLPP
jgi:hypothetical protein